MVSNRMGIDLGNDQGHLGIHPPITTFIDDDTSALNSPGYKLGRNIVGRARDDQLDPVERFGTELLDGEFFTAKLQRRAGRPLARQKLELSGGELTLFEESANDPAHSAGRPDNRYGIEHGESLPIMKMEVGPAWRRWACLRS